MNQAAQASDYLYRRVERHILDGIESGRLAPGDRIPSLRSLANRLGVGIATVNHAYLELERKGVVESRPRSGFFVLGGASGPPIPKAGRGETPIPRSVNRSRLILDVLETLGDKRLLPLGVVCPTPELLPARDLERSVRRVMASRPERALDYESIHGSIELRRQIAWRGGPWTGPQAPEDLVVTSGAMEALYISLRCTTRPGDAVLIQSPAYYCVMQLMETLGLRVIEIDSHPERGVDPADVAEAAGRLKVASAVFTANYNNPDGTSLTSEAKGEIVRILADRSIPLIEDDVSGDLYFSGPRPDTFKAHDRKGLVLYCSSFSKAMGAGFRTGWLAPGRYMEQALEAKATTSVCNPGLTQLALADYLATGRYETHLKKLRRTLRDQMETIRFHISGSFPEGTHVSRPEGGLVLWCELPEGTDATRLFFLAREEGIGIAPGQIFTTRERFNNYIRLSCGVAWDEGMAEGLSRLGVLAGG